MKMYCIGGSLLTWAVKLQHFRNWSGLSRYIYKPRSLRCFAQLPACLLASLSTQTRLQDEGPIAWVCIYLHSAAPGSASSTSSGTEDWEWGWTLGLSPSFIVAAARTALGTVDLLLATLMSSGQAGHLLLQTIPGSPGMLQALCNISWHSHVGWLEREDVGREVVKV